MIVFNDTLKSFGLHKHVNSSTPRGNDVGETGAKSNRGEM